MAKPIEFRVLGPLQILRAGKDLTPSGSREQTLIAALAMRVGEVVGDQDLMEILWGEHPPRSGSKAVQGAVSRTRADLGRWKDVIDRRDGGYVLDVPPEHVDAALFTMLVTRARRAMEEFDTTEAVRCLREALDLWRDDEPCDLGDSIAGRAEMLVLSDARVAAQEDLFEAALAMGEDQTLVSEIDRVLERHPQRERLWVHLMLALYRSGKRSEALAAFARASDLMAERFGLDPSPDLRELEERMLAQDPTLLIVAPAPPVDLPDEATPFAGRGPELDELMGLIEKPGLVTITGVGGVGKSRLALHVARATSADFDGAVLWREASSVSLDLESGPERRLLVLDGCGPEVRTQIEALLVDPGLTVLATALTPIGLDGEHVVRLEPFVASIGGPSASVRLFVDSARLADPWFDPADERTIGDICARVGGLPLAIELAATCVRSMTPAEILRRLDERFPGAAELSVLDTLEWVWDRLSKAEQQTFARASVFTGPFTAEVMESVLEGSTAAVDTLAERALLIRAKDRYRIPGAARAFARERLTSSGDEGLAARAHADAITGLAERLGEEVTGAREGDAVRDIHAWLGDIRLVFESALAQRNADVALRIPYALRWFALLRFNDEVFEWARAAGTTFEREDHPLVGEVLGCAALHEPPLIERARVAAARLGAPGPVMATFAEATVAARNHDVATALARAGDLIASDDVFAGRYWRGETVRLLLESGDRPAAVRAMNAYRLAAARLACPSLRALALQAFAAVQREDDPAAAESMAAEAVALAAQVHGRLVLARA